MLLRATLRCASPVLTATGFVNGRGQFSTPTESIPLDRSPKTLLLLTTSVTHRPTAVPNWVQIRLRGLLGEWVKYNEFIYFFIYYYRSDPSTDFHTWWLKRRRLAQGCAVWGFCWYYSPFWGWNPPLKTPILRAWIGVFKPNGQNIESFMLSKLLHRFQPNFAQR